MFQPVFILIRFAVRIDVCFFFVQYMSTASTIQSKTRQREIATRLQNPELLTKLELWDMVALDVRYHIQSLNALANRDGYYKCQIWIHQTQAIGGIALGKLVSYVQEVKQIQKSSPLELKKRLLKCARTNSLQKVQQQVVSYMLKKMRVNLLIPQPMQTMTVMQAY